MYFGIMKSVLVLFYVSVFLVRNSEGAKILVVVPTPSYSHQVVFQALWRELALKGHHVTVLTTDPINDPTLETLTEIDLSFSYKLFNEKVALLMDSTNMMTAMTEMIATINEIADQQFSHPSVRKLLKNETEYFDLLIAEVQWHAVLGFSYRFNCPYIGMLSYDANNYAYGAVGNPTHPVLYPDFFAGFGKNLNVLERITTVLIELCLNLFVKFYYIPSERPVTEKHFGKNVPSLESLIENMDLLFLNTDVVFSPARPLIPSIVQIGGGTHRKTQKPLPKNLQEVLDDSKDGVIYFSLGSNVKSMNLSKELRDCLISTFSELPYTILWKFEMDVLPDKPKNVFISKWFPQQDIFRNFRFVGEPYRPLPALRSDGKIAAIVYLEHSNMKLVITQGGLQSMEEAIYDHIPMVGIPFYADQPKNIADMVSKGMGLSVNRYTVTKKVLRDTILEVINNPKYRNKVIDLSKLALDQPMSGLEKAVWWIEYVLRHKGAKHLRSPMLDIPFYQYYLLDVLGFILVVGVTVTYLLFKAVKFLVKMVKFGFFKLKMKAD